MPWEVAWEHVTIAVPGAERSDLQAWILVIATEKREWVREEGNGSIVLKPFFHIYSSMNEFAFV